MIRFGATITGCRSRRDLLGGAVMAIALVVSGAGDRARAADAEGQQLEAAFAKTVLPFVEANCAECHANGVKEGDLDLSVFATMDQVVDGHARWETVLERLEAGEMPPKEATNHPSPDERAAVVSWIRAVRSHVARRDAGDPGEVLARRLSNAEYNYSVRDLTGVDIRPTAEFPVDPTNAAGFDNSGESLAMSPALLKKYLEAARKVSDYLVLLPHGLAFAPHPVVANTDRDKYCVLRIVDFYYRQQTDVAEYLLAAWRYKHRAALGQPAATLDDVAATAKVSAPYLKVVWAALEEAPIEVGPMATLQAKWRELPAPAAGEKAESEAVLDGCVALRDWIVELRGKLQPQFDNLKLKGVATGSQPFILWKNRQYATHRMIFDAAVLQVDGVAADLEPRNIDDSQEFGDVEKAEKVAEAEKVEKVEKKRREEAASRNPRGSSTGDADLFVPGDSAERAPYEASFAKFCAVFPDAFYVAERGRAQNSFAKQKQDKGRLLTAGFHNSHGYFRDDQPLYELILDDAGRRELDELWLELDFVAMAPERQHADFIFYERAESKTIRGPEFDFVRSEDKDAASEAKVLRMADVYLANAQKSLDENGGDADSIPAIRDYFTMVNARLRSIEKARSDAEPSHLEALVALAERAYRRPLSSAERDDLMAFYRSLREEGELDHETAVRDTLVRVLMSPRFCYRVDRVAAGPGVQPLSDFDLASRLSYFLWSSLPDRELLGLAAAGKLHEPETLAAQARRMLHDKRAWALAVEFGGNWLDIRRFEEHNAVDRERFPTFNDELRAAMFEEPIRYFVDVMDRDASVLEFIDGRHTLVNSALAKHYGMPEPAGAAPDAWVRVDNADAYGRGGLLPMAVFLTKNAPGLRTSPVKRGYWVVKRVLGETIPPPPAVVPELPHDEAAMGELTLRQTLEKHRADPSCAACHARFDSFGLVFEGYGPIGERRDVDLGGRPVDASAEFPGGDSGVGVEHLRKYIDEHRRQSFVDNLCRKLLTFGLGRTLMLSDEPLIESMEQQLAANDDRFSTLVESIVTSPQFRTKRGRADLAPQGEQ